MCVDCTTSRNRRHARNKRMLDTYGLSEGDYAKLVEYQRGLCFICQRRPRYKLDLDHDHKTGERRGLLCKVCNRRLLPAVQDDIERLKRAIAYLEWPPARNVFGKPTYVPSMTSE